MLIDGEISLVFSDLSSVRYFFIEMGSLVVCSV